VVEGLIFASDSPVSAEKLLPAFIEDVQAGEIQAAILELKEDYEERRSALELREVAGGWQFRTRPDLSLHILRLGHKAPPRLSRAALETLAVVAYRQPILRAEIEKIRGVDAGGVLRSLMEKDLVKVSQRNDRLPGRPMLYSTTKRFLETFDLPSLSDLPSIQEMDRMCPPAPEIRNKLFD
jgi:segregation and condensation protein B